MLICVTTLIFSCDKEKEESIRIVSAGSDITASVTSFRAIAGSSVNTQPGASGGRREITWESVPEELLDQPLPQDFFNAVGPNADPANQRGLRYSTVGSFRVSADGFSSLNPLAAAEFDAFSGQKVFANVSSNLWDVEFEVPGAAQPAATRSIGIVFSDVDEEGTTFIEVFNGNESLGKYFVPAHDNSSSFSFLGIHFPDNVITRVRIGHEGTLSSGEPDGTGGTDLVVLDDFIYSEPVAR